MFNYQFCKRASIYATSVALLLGCGTSTSGNPNQGPDAAPDTQTVSEASTDTAIDAWVPESSDPADSHADVHESGLDAASEPEVWVDIESSCDGLDNDGDGTLDEGCPCSEGDTQRCYVGQHSQAGIGACEWGQQSCTQGEHGQAWGECTGSGIPSSETCGDQIDQDCSGEDLLCPPTCPNETCGDGETCESCPDDCGACPSCTLTGYGTLAHGQSVETFEHDLVSCYETCGRIKITCNMGSLEGGSEYIDACVVDGCPCSLPAYGHMDHGASVQSYESTSVVCGESCTKKTITCVDGKLEGGSLYLASCSVGRCTPVWPMMRNDPWGNAASSLDGPSTNALKWSTQAGTTVAQTSAVVQGDGTIYVAAGGALVAIGPDGTQRWSQPVGSLVRGSPVIDSNERIIVGTSLGEIRVYSSKGELERSTSTLSFVTTSLTLSGGLVYFGSIDGTVAAVNPYGNSPTFVWARSIGASVTSTPIIHRHTGSVYAANSKGELHAFSSSGSKEWVYKGTVSGTAIAMNFHGALYVPDGDRVTCLQSDGTVYWRSPVLAGTITGAPAIYNTLVHVVAGGTLYSIHQGTGVIERTFTPPYGVPASTTSPVVGRDATVYVGIGTRVFALDYLGAPLWERTMPSALAGAPSIGINRTLFIGSQSGAWHAFGL